jgi:hypothetical protein
MAWRGSHSPYRNNGVLGRGKTPGSENLALKRASAILGSAIFLVVAPGTLAVYVPWTICRWQISRFSSKIRLQNAPLILAAEVSCF